MDGAGTARKVTLRLRTDAVARALHDCFRAGRVRVPEATARVWTRSTEPQRAALLGMLLKSVGPLALSVLAAGRFAHLMHRERWADLALTFDEIREVSASQVAEIARYVEQANPAAVRAISDWLAAHPASLAALGAGAIATLVQMAIARQRATGDETAPAPRRDDRDWLDD